jgi:putative transposase
MARPPRVLCPGGVYHVTARGNRKETIFRDERDCAWFFALLREVVTERQWRCHGYCLLPNHYHLLLETPEADLSGGMQRLNSRYAQAFNHRHEMSGHLFQGRFHSVLVRDDRHLLELVRYLALNPVRAGLCREPGEWPWSSYRAVLAQPGPRFPVAVDLPLEWFHSDPERARKVFRAFIHEPLLAAR